MISPVTVTFSLYDFLGFVPDTRRTKVVLTTNVASGFIADTSTGGGFRITDTRVTISSTGVASFSVLPSGATGLNPAAYQIRVQIDAANPATRQRAMVDLGYYTITAACDLKDLVAAQYVPPTYLSSVTTALDAKVTAAAGSATAAAASAALATSISGISTSDGVVTTLVNNPASTTAAALTASYVSSTKIASGPGIDPTGVADCTAAVQAILTAMGTYTSDGGRLIFPKGRYKFTGSLTSDTPNLEICGEGGRGQDGNVGNGATQLHYTGSGTFLTYNPLADSTIFRGPVFRNITIAGSSAGTVGLRLNRVNNFILDNVTISDFTTGKALMLDGTGSVNQYGTLDNLQISNCLNGVDAVTCNGLRVIGGHFQGLSASTGYGLRTTGGGDTLRLHGTNIQGYQYLVDLQTGRGHELHGLRGEDWSTTAAAIRIATACAAVFGGSLNNTLRGATGTAIEVTSTASGTMLIPGNIVQGVTTPVSDSAADTLILSAEINRPVVMFPPPTGGNDYAALQAAITALGNTNGGVLVLQRGTYLIGTPLTIPSKVILRGQGRDTTVIKRSGSLGGDYVLVRLGSYNGSAWTPVHGNRIEHLAIDADGKQLCIEAKNLQEMAGWNNVILSNFSLYGAQIDSASANFAVDLCEVYPQTAGAQRGIYINGASGANILSRITCGVTGHLDTGIRIYQSTVTVTGAHFERCDDGLLWDDAGGAAIGVTGPTGGSTVTSLIRMMNNSRYVACVNVTKNGATNTVKDDFFTKTVTDPSVQQMTMGDQYVARLNHYGDKAGFYGTTAITKPTGVAVTAAGIHAALVSLGLIAP